ncbi:MAG: DUF2971 domain-containing protein [Planctomycetota bacterium]
MDIYKYVTVDTWFRVVQSGTIRATQPGALNDILECRPAIRSIADTERIKELAPSEQAIDEMIESQLDKILAELPPEVVSLFPGGRSFLRDLVRKQELTSTTRDLTIYIAELLGPMVGPLFHQQLDEKLGVLSFAETGTSASMWDRYSDGGRGVVMCLDREDEFFNPEPGFPNSPKNLKPVKYIPERDSKYMLDLDHVETFFTKTDDWAGEREVRMVRQLRECQDTGVTDAAGNRVFVVDLPPSALRAVAFGQRCPDSQREKIREALSQSQYGHAALMEAYLDSHSSSIRLRSC